VITASLGGVTGRTVARLGQDATIGNSETRTKPNSPT